MEITIKKGLDLRIAGNVSSEATKPRLSNSTEVAIAPDDFPGFVAKVEVKPGDSVRAGDALMHHKDAVDVKLVSPVAGTVLDVVRGERRRVLRVIVKADSADLKRSFDKADFANPDAIATTLAQSGLLALMRQRPYDIVPNPAVRPRDIFVTAFDSAPLAVSSEWSSADKPTFDAAVSLLAHLTSGKIYISRRNDSAMPDVAGAVMVNVHGPHPAGLAGVQIANIKPVNKGEVVWTLSAETLHRIGTLALTGAADWKCNVAITGSEVNTPFVAQTTIGAKIDTLLNGALNNNSNHKRIIAGNVLTGVKENLDGYIHFPYSQITVIPEGDDVHEFMGWASISPKKMSVSPSFPGRWLKRIFTPDARTLGGRRAMIQSGEYESVLPMDIMAEYLIKAIKSQNIDDMERLGIYEIAPEDFALAEVIDSSKQPLQAIVRNGLDYLRKEIE
jgi:Na+-transporting NADH:ubiquinone oxidoreductase subunit A